MRPCLVVAMDMLKQGGSITALDPWFRPPYRHAELPRWLPVAEADLACTTKMRPTMPERLRHEIDLAGDGSITAEQSDVARWGRRLRLVAGPGLRIPRSWTTIAAFLCGAAGAIPFALESHSAQASTPYATATNASVAVSAVGTVQRVYPRSREEDRPAAEAPPTPSSRTEASAMGKPERAASAAAQRVFNGRPIRAVRTVTMRVTAYSPDERSCGASADNITASGYSIWTNGGRLVAADTSVLPLGSMVSIPGYDTGDVVPVLDRGGAIKGHRLDVLFPTHEQAKRWGVRDLKVTIYEYADGEPNDFRENHWSHPTGESAGRATRLTDASPS